MVSGQAGKGSSRRPSQVSREEEDLRWDLALGKIEISEEEFNKRIEEIRKRTGKPNFHCGRGW